MTEPLPENGTRHRGMKIFKLEREQIVSWDITRTWKFFSDPRNLATITPPNLDFVVTSELPDHTYSGLRISYRVRPLLRVPVSWLTEITAVREPHYFVDEQQSGPYRLWRHEHFFEELPHKSGTLVRDRVTYGFAFFPLDVLIHACIVGPRLEEIFNYRAEVIGRISSSPRP